jgi:hypothetical protein
MFSTDDQEYYLERADMHDKLAGATNDGPARKVHQAMAAEYRRRAEAIDGSLAPGPADRLLKVSAVAR